MVYFSGEHGFEGGTHVVVGFAGGSVDHVKVDVLESGGAGFFRGLHRPPWGVAAFQYLQDTAGCGLHAQRHPRVACLQQPLEEFGRGGFWVGFGGHFRTRRDAETFAHVSQHLCKPRSSEHGGRAPTNKHGVGGLQRPAEAFRS